jgi:hypothetical protein
VEASSQVKKKEKKKKNCTAQQRRLQIQRLTPLQDHRRLYKRVSRMPGQVAHRIAPLRELPTILCQRHTEYL